MDEYKLLQIGKLIFLGTSVYIFVWLIRGLIVRKWWY
jgi:hypothetical protein